MTVRIDVGLNYKAGMFVYGVAFLLGVVLLQQFSVLPSFSFFISTPLVFSVFTFWALYYSSRYRNLCKSLGYNRVFTLTIILISLIYLGLVASAIAGSRVLEQQLASEYIGKNIIITGTVASIPVSSGNAQRFEFRVDNYRLPEDMTEEMAGNVGNRYKLDDTGFPKKIRLSWYYAEKVNADEKWQLEVRLKPPHGFMNPGGFDYEAWLFQHGINATGYVRKSGFNQRIAETSEWPVNRFRQSLGFRIDQLANVSHVPAVVRHFLHRLQVQGLQTKGEATGKSTEAETPSTLALIKALAIGDKSSISTQQWQVLTNTGTSHLMAISGLHIGLAALFANILVRRLVPVCFLRVLPAQHVALIGGFIVALLYALVAGFSIPTQRALIMLAALSLMLLLRHNHRPLDALGFALVVILLFDPLAVLSVGFWFSFAAVAVIFISITRAKKNDVKPSFWLSIKTILKGWIRIQILISLFLLPLSLFMFQQVSLVAPVANLFLIPYVSFFVVPLVLLAIIVSFVSTGISGFLFEGAAILLELVWPLLSTLASQPFALWQYSNMGIISLLLASSALLLIYYSREISQFFAYSAVNNYSQIHCSLKLYNRKQCWLIRGLSLALLLCCFLPEFITAESALSDGEIELTVLDVGQGSAAVIQTKNHSLVFDAGAKFSEKLDTGSSIIIPFLRLSKITAIDALVISHGDADHIGGAQALLDEYPNVSLIGQDVAKLESTNKQLCFSGIKWQWDEVDFTFLSPQKSMSYDESKVKDVRNNHSCVLRVSSAFGSILLTGDIEHKIERQLLEKYGAQLDSDILIVPHHGSNTSSTMPFISTVNPKISIISAGYKNRYNLPNDKVLKRYAQYYQQHHRHHYAQLENYMLQTSSSGAISLILNAESTIKFQQYRESSGKYWHHKESIN